MNYEELKSRWIQEELHAFYGWDFAHLQSRWQHEALDWDYKSIVGEYLRPADHILDMGTGGGEFLLSLGHPYINTSVTEAWPPNIELCMDKLKPLGIEVFPVLDDTSLPIDDNCFDIVLNRQESYDLHEVKRILKPNGIFITQQVGGENCVMLGKRINLEPHVQQPFSLSTELPKFYNCGFSVKYSNECFPC